MNIRQPLAFPFAAAFPGPVTTDADRRQYVASGQALRWVSIQAYFAVHLSRSTPSLFLIPRLYLEPRILSPYPRQFHLLWRHDLCSRSDKFACIERIDPVTQGLVAYAQFPRHDAIALPVLEPLRFGHSLPSHLLRQRKRVCFVMLWRRQISRDTAPSRSKDHGDLFFGKSVLHQNTCSKTT